jgi:hypothetical protein
MYINPHHLMAWVRQDGRLGRNLLVGRVVRDVGLAKSLCRAQFMGRDVEIEFDVEGPPQ